MIEYVKKSIITGKLNIMDIPISANEFEVSIIKYNKGGVLIQDVFPELPKELREFIQSGITPTEWDEYLGKPQDKEN